MGAIVIETQELSRQEQVERAVLGCLWIDYPNDDALDRIQAGWFYSSLNRRLFEFLREIRSEDLPADIVIIGNRLNSEGKRRLFIEALEMVSSATLIDQYVAQLRMAYADRTITRILNAGNLAPEDKLIIRELLEDSESARTPVGTRPHQVMNSLVEEIETTRGRGPKMPIGFDALDSRIGGYHPGELLTIGAYTGIGKTIFLTTLAHRLIRAGTLVLYFSTEMADREFLKERLLPAYSGVHALALRMNSLSDGQMTQIRQGAAKLADAPIIIIDASSPALPDIRQAIKINRPAVVFVDHVHRCKFPKAENQNLAINKFITGLKSIARDLNLPIVAAAQLNRSAGNPDVPPSINHLRDSGSLEMESDIVILLHRKSRKDPHILANVAKNRHGESGSSFRMELDKASLLLGEPADDVLPEWQGER